MRKKKLNVQNQTFISFVSTPEAIKLRHAYYNYTRRIGMCIYVYTLCVNVQGEKKTDGKNKKELNRGRKQERK